MASTSSKFALNKRTLSRKSVSTRQNEAFDKKSISTSRKNCFPLARIEYSLKNAISLDWKATFIRISIWKKLRKTVSSSRNNFFLKYSPPCNYNNGFLKMWMKEYRFHSKENLLPLAVIKESFKIYFQEMEKLLPMEGIFEILAQNGSH